MAYTPGLAHLVAAGEIGYRESGNNDTKFNRWLGTIGGYGAGGYGYPWCASFQSWVAAKAGGRANVDYPKTAGCAVGVSWFKSHGRWSSTPHVGDWVFYGPGGTTHVELVVGVTGSSITTIGGNTSGSLNGTYFNGDGVYRKTVARNSTRIYGYGRPAYTTTEDDMQLSDKVTVKDWLKKRWPKDTGLADGAISVNTALVSGYGYARIAAESAARIERQLDAQAAVIDRLVDQLGAAAPDLEALKASIREAIEGIEVRLDVPDQT